MSRYSLNTIVEFRPCGSCQACCTVVGVIELAKPEWTRCQLQCASGCAIYDERPATCRGYSCLWQAGILDGDERRRPDNLGIIFDTRRDSDGSDVIQAWEVWPGALNEPQALYLVKRLAEQHMVLVRLYGQRESVY